MLLIRAPRCAADIISAVEFDWDGRHLATGDRGGRVVLFEQVPTQPVRLRLCCCLAGSGAALALGNAVQRGSLVEPRR